jgi:hypothetical protein
VASSMSDLRVSMAIVNTDKNRKHHINYKSYLTGQKIILRLYCEE